MRSSVVTSAVLHGLVLTWALVTIGAPESFKVEDTEAMPVDIVSADSLSAQGDQKAPPKEKPAPKPTTRPTEVEKAENMGDNKVDVKTPPVPNAKPNDNESAAAPKATEKPLPKTDPVPNEVKEISKEETDVTDPKEVAAIPESKPEVTPTPPQPETKPQEQAQPEEKPDAEALPENVPLPAVKPQVKPPEQKPVEKPPEKKPDQPKVADKTSDRKKDDQKHDMAKAASSKQSDFNADEIAALLNKQDPSNGGAKRSTEVASLGAKKSTGGQKLSADEMEGLRSLIRGNWNILPGLTDMDKVQVTVKFELDQSGAIIGDPQVEISGDANDGTKSALSGGAKRAVLKSAPFKLDPAKFDTWHEMIVHFDASDLAM
ncbi:MULTISPECIES: hypothetical protein [unclassified Sinorhizobium]|uniref:hypothetical protein n=1 Tax=unclassified Sinorhizobium TaxID=2613772 RepID=UPI0035269F26